MLSPWLLLIPGVPLAVAGVFAWLWRLERKERGEWQAQAIKLAGRLRDEVMRQNGALRVLRDDLARDRAHMADDALADPTGERARLLLQRRLRDAADDTRPIVPRRDPAKP